MSLNFGKCRTVGIMCIHTYVVQQQQAAFVGHECRKMIATGGGGGGGTGEGGKYRCSGRHN